MSDIRRGLHKTSYLVTFSWQGICMILLFFLALFGQMTLNKTENSASVFSFHSSWHNRETSSSVCATCKAPLSLSCSKCLVLPIPTSDQPLQMQSCSTEKQTETLMESLHLKNQLSPLATENGKAYRNNEQDQPVSLVMNRDVEYGQDSMDLPVHFEDISSNSPEVRMSSICLYSGTVLL